ARRTTSRRPCSSTSPRTTCSRACCSCWVYSAATATRQPRISRKGASAPFLLLLAHLSFEHRDRLHVRRMREHVDHARGGEPVRQRIHQHPCVACEGRRVAGNVDDPRRRFLTEGLH